jgi:hypothetical protein
MEKVDKQKFEAWVKESNWLQIGETQNPNGRQHTYLTPAGNLMVAIYDLEGKLAAVAQLVPQSPTTSSPRIFPFPGQPFRGKQ